MFNIDQSQTWSALTKCRDLTGNLIAILKTLLHETRK